MKNPIIVELFLDNAQSQPKLSIVENGVVKENIPTNYFSLYPKTDGILLHKSEISPHKEGYKIKCLK